MFSSPLEIAVLLVLVALLFGPGKVAKVMGEVGKGFKEFKNAERDARTALTIEDAVEVDDDATRR